MIYGLWQRTYLTYLMFLRDQLEILVLAPVGLLQLGVDLLDLLLDLADLVLGRPPNVLLHYELLLPLRKKVGFYDLFYNLFIAFVPP